MFERLKGLGKRDPERVAARKQRRADRAARRAERKGTINPERDAAMLDAGARHYGGMAGGIDPGAGGGPFGG